MGRLRINFLCQFSRARFQIRREFPFHPMNIAGQSRNVAHGPFPSGAGNFYGWRLDRALNEQPTAIAALRGPGNFSALPEHIRFFVADKALARPGGARIRREFRRNAELMKRALNPFMDSMIAFHGFQSVPGMGGRKNQTVSPISVVRHEASAGRPPDQRPQQSHLFRFSVFLEVTEGSGGFDPTVKAQHWPPDRWRCFEQGRVQRHVMSVAAGTGAQQIP